MYCRKEGNEFSEKDYKRFDILGKETGHRFLTECLDFYPDPNFNFSEKYDYDISVVKNGITYYVETEVKTDWHESGKWAQFPTMHVLSRKNKNKSHLFIMFNRIPFELEKFITYTDLTDTLAITTMESVRQAHTNCLKEGKTIGEIDTSRGPCDVIPVPMDVVRFYTGTYNNPTGWREVDQWGNTFGHNMLKSLGLA